MELSDDLMNDYVEWREACIALRKAYEQWSGGHVGEKQSAYAAYRAALDREEQASAFYADRVSRVARHVPDPMHAVAA